MDNTQDNSMLADAVEQLLAGCCPPAVVRHIEDGGSAAALWHEIEASGFADALVPEAQGGAGLSLADVAPIVEACGRHALPLPLAQTMLARGLLQQAGGGLSVALASTRSGAVSYGAVADAVLLRDGAALQLLDLRGTVREAVDAGSLDATLNWNELKPLARIESAVDLRAIEAVLLAAQMAGAMRRANERTLQYANERVQFGRSIGKFQAIQHQLSVMAEHVAAATMAARMAFATSGTVPQPLACAMAKARTSEAAVPVAAIAHALHGAIGITEEFDLQLTTRRLHAWRLTAGSESYWNERIGRALLASELSVPEFARTVLCPSLSSPPLTPDPRDPS